MLKSVDVDDEFDSGVLNIALDTLKIGKQALIFANTKKSATQSDVRTSRLSGATADRDCSA